MATSPDVVIATALHYYAIFPRRVQRACAASRRGGMLGDAESERSPLALPASPHSASSPPHLFGGNAGHCVVCTEMRPIERLMISASYTKMGVPPALPGRQQQFDISGSRIHGPIDEALNP